MRCIILCGGLGTRLGGHAGNVPKPLAPIGGRPVLEHQIALAREAGIRDVTLLTGHLAEMIEGHFGDGERFGVRIDYFRESTPLGTTGGVKAIEGRLDDDFLLLYGDVMMWFDVSRLVRFHRGRDALATLVVHPNDHPYDSDLLELGEDGRVVAFHPKPHPPVRYLANLVNAGAYVLSPGILGSIELGVKADFGRDIFPRLVGTGRLFGYNTPEYLKDMGTPDRYDRVVADWASGRIERMHLRNPRPAIFLDRDGVVNRYVDHLRTPEEFNLLPGVESAVRRINRSDYLAALVTNQPVIAKGMATFEQVAEVHRKLETLLGAEHAKLDAIALCPHHPERGHAGEVPELKVACECRKPAPGMIRRLADELNVDLAASYLIGDTARDLQCARNAGVTGVGVRTGLGCRGLDPPPPLFFDDLAEAVDFLLEDPSRGIADAVWERVAGAGRDPGRPFVIAIDGPPRSGKTTLAAYLARSLRLRRRRPLHLRPGEEAPADAGSDVLILDGAAPPGRPDLRIDCDADAGVRESRLRAYYHWIGIDPDEADRLIRSRREPIGRADGIDAGAHLHVNDGRLAP
jgi:histidinol-phosphate phosphatase family protein